MIDINHLKENPEAYRDTIKKKNQKDKLPLVDEAVRLDTDIKALKASAQKLRADRNKVSEAINEAKKSGKDVKKVLEEAKEIPKKIEQIEAEQIKLEHELDGIIRAIPNIMHKDVPIGKDGTDNVETMKIGTVKNFKFPVKAHSELAEELGIADFDSARNVAGTGFYYLEGDLALLNQALIRFAIDKMVLKGFRYIETPLMLRGDVIANVTDLNDQKMQIYKIQDQDAFLIGTSEHSLIGRFIDTAIEEKKLPIKHTSYSMCFRKEIGSHGIDEKGLFRTHQFNKVEMIVICNPKESMKYFEEIKNITLDIFRELEIPVRVLQICSGDMGDLKHIQVDIEAWSPRRKEYFEVGSCSNLTDAQARKLKIRVGVGDAKYTPHTLNNTALATSRALVAILENNQNEDGSIAIPKVLVPYMQGKTKITKEG